MNTHIALILIAATTLHAQLAPSSGSLSNRPATSTKKPSGTSRPAVPSQPYVAPSVPRVAPPTASSVTRMSPEVRAMEGTQALRDIRAAAAVKWAANFDMQQFEIEKQAKAYTQIAAYQREVPGLPKAESDTIINAAQLKWKTNYDMVVYEIEKQAKAWLALNR